MTILTSFVLGFILGMIFMFLIALLHARRKDDEIAQLRKSGS